MRIAAALVGLLCTMMLPGCTSDDVKEFEIHIGWNADGSQYMTPKEIRVSQGDKVRFVVTNEDDPTKDYNGNRPGKDNFHDVALLNYDTDGDGRPESIEHEVPAGQTVTTHYMGKDYFIAGQKGTFRIICEVRTSPSHEALGMWATFIVS